MFYLLFSLCTDCCPLPSVILTGFSPLAVSLLLKANSKTSFLCIKPGGQERCSDRKRQPLSTEWVLKDTVDDPASLDVALLAEMQLDKLPKAAGVVVVDGLGVSKGLHDGTEEQDHQPG